MTHVTRALQSHNLSGEGIISRTYRPTYFLTTQGHGRPRRMRDQLNAGATFETTRTWKTMHIIHAPIHFNKTIMKGWLWRPNDIQGPCGLNLPDIWLTGEEKPRKNLIQETCPDRELNPGPLRGRRACSISYSLLVPRFAGSIQAGVDEFFQSVKILSMTSFGREVKPWVPCRRFTARKRTSSLN